MKNQKTEFSLDKIKIPSLKKEKSISEILNTSQQNKVNLTKEAVSDIHEQILLREQIHLQALDEMDKIKLQLSNMLLGSDIDEQEKSRIRQKQVDLEQFKVQEKIDKWKDIAILKKELRDRLKEFKETESKTQLMADLLED